MRIDPPTEEAPAAAPTAGTVDKDALVKLLNALPGLAYECSVAAPWTLKYVSEGVQRLTGYESHAFTAGGMVWGDIVHPDDFGGVAAEVDAAVADRRQFTLTYRIVCRWGEERWALERGEALYDADGKALSLFGFIGDISEQKAIEQRLRDSEDRLELAVQAHSIGIFDTDVTSGQVRWNAQLEIMYGYEPGSFGTTLDAWRHHVLPNDLARVNLLFQRAIAAKVRDLAYAYRMRRSDGEIRHIEASARFFYDDQGRNIRRVGVNIDVTERKAAEREFLETQAELIHLSRISSLGAMASSLGHELNQPLTAIGNYVAAAKAFSKRDDAQAKRAIGDALDGALAASARAGELIKRIRGMVRRDPPKPRQLSLTALVKETALLALHDAKLREISLVVEVPPEDNIVGDPVQLQQVLFNLLRNASEAMAGGKRQEITVRASRSAGQGVVVEVQDTGPGLDPEIAANLFTAFHTTKRDGMGVGLSICRTIIESQAGKIWAESRPGRTSFFFTIPAPPTLAAHAERAMPDDPLGE